MKKIIVMCAILLSTACQPCDHEHPYCAKETPHLIPPPDMSYCYLYDNADGKYGDAGEVKICSCTPGSCGCIGNKGCQCTAYGTWDCDTLTVIKNGITEYACYVGNNNYTTYSCN